MRDTEEDCSSKARPGLGRWNNDPHLLFFRYQRDSLYSVYHTDPGYIPNFRWLEEHASKNKTGDCRNHQTYLGATPKWQIRNTPGLRT